MDRTHYRMGIGEYARNFCGAPLDEPGARSEWEATCPACIERLGGAAAIERQRLLSAALTRLPQDYEPWGQVDPEADPATHDDCSCGCRFFIPIVDRTEQGPDGDWGVCLNPRSHRCGLLTFEHQGCLRFEPEPDED